MGISSSYSLHIPPKIFFNMGAIQMVAMGLSAYGHPVYVHELFSGGASTQGSFDVYFFFGEETGPELPICSEP